MLASSSTTRTRLTSVASAGARAGAAERFGRQRSLTAATRLMSRLRKRRRPTEPRGFYRP